MVGHPSSSSCRAWLSFRFWLEFFISWTIYVEIWCDDNTISSFSNDACSYFMPTLVCTIICFLALSILQYQPPKSLGVSSLKHEVINFFSSFGFIFPLHVLSNFEVSHIKALLISKWSKTNHLKSDFWATLYLFFTNTLLVKAFK